MTSYIMEQAKFRNEVCLVLAIVSYSMVL